MGLEAALECQNHSIAGRCSKITQSSSCQTQERDTKGKLKHRSNRLKSLDEDFTDLTLGHSPCTSCKITPSRPCRLNDNAEVKRGSAYQNTKTVRKMKRLGVLEEARKIQSSHSSDISSLSFEIVASLSHPGQKEGGLVPQQIRSPRSSRNADPNSSFLGKDYMVVNSTEFLDLSFHHPGDYSSSGISSPAFVTSGDGLSNGFSQICLGLQDAENIHEEMVPELVERGLVNKLKCRSDRTHFTKSDSNRLSVREGVLTLQKSLSEKGSMPGSTIQLEFNQSKAYPRTQFSPLRKVFDPIMKSKSQRNPSFSVTDIDSPTTIVSPCIKKNATIRKSLLQDFSKMAQKTECTRGTKKDQSSVTCSSPVNLCGHLKLKKKHGIPFFEFSSRDPEEYLAAKACCSDDASNWMYMFHSVNSKKKGSGSPWGSKDRHKKSPMVGQMQVACYLSSEMRDGGPVDISTVTEFVLYDTARATKNFAAQEPSHCSPNSIQPDKGVNWRSFVTGRGQESNCMSEPGNTRTLRDASGNVDSDALASYPSLHLHPHLEIAAIVVEFPLETAESLKYKRGDKDGGKEYPKLCDIASVDHSSGVTPSIMNPAKMEVVTSIGIHGLPNAKESGPSPLLERWRSGGHCDCGGWDMACPIVVMGNPCGERVTDYPFLENQRLLELFVQGAKEKAPALTITIVDEGQYSIDFHAQLSALQAFSICVALLHSAEVSTPVGQERMRQRLACNSLKVLLKEEVRFSIGAEAEEEKRKVIERTEEMPPSVLLNPPFSPIGRV